MSQQSPDRPESVGSSPSRVARRRQPHQVPDATPPEEPFPAVGGSSSRQPSLGYRQVPPASQGTPLEAWGAATSSEDWALRPQLLPADETYVTLPGTGGTTAAQHPAGTYDPDPEIIPEPQPRAQQARARAQRAAARQAARPVSGAARAARSVAASVGNAIAACFPGRGRGASSGSGRGRSRTVSAQMSISGGSEVPGGVGHGGPLQQSPVGPTELGVGGVASPPLTATLGSSDQPPRAWAEGGEGHPPPPEGSPEPQPPPPEEPHPDDEPLPPPVVALPTTPVYSLTGLSASLPMSPQAGEDLYNLTRPITRGELEQALLSMHYDFVVWQGTVRVYFARGIFEPPSLPLLAVPKAHVLPLRLPPSLRPPRSPGIPVCATVPWWDPRVTAGMIRKKCFLLSAQQQRWRDLTYDARRNLWKVDNRAPGRQHVLEQLHQRYTYQRDRFAMEQQQEIADQRAALVAKKIRLGKNWEADQSGPESEGSPMIPVAAWATTFGIMAV